MPLPGTISVDLDTFRSLFYKNGEVPDKEYDGREFEEGLSNLCCFFEEFGIRTTLFCVGQDLVFPKNQQILKSVASHGHEVANHTMHHVQGLRLLPMERKEEEIAAFEDICLSAIGEKPVGFRAPGWNIDEAVLEILVRRGYQYDSSIFPTFLMPIMKMTYYATARANSFPDRTTMGRLRYMLCPIEPFQTKRSSFQKGKDGLWEFPVSVSPGLRFPFFATMLLKTGIDHFKKTFRKIKEKDKPVQLMLHLFDFVDFSSDYYHRQVARLKRVYVPQSMRMDFAKKIDLIKAAVSIAAAECDFKTYKERCNS
jgi:hypothetical protein